MKIIMSNLGIAQRMAGFNTGEPEFLNKYFQDSPLSIKKQMFTWTGNKMVLSLGSVLYLKVHLLEPFSTFYLILMGKIMVLF